MRARLALALLALLCTAGAARGAEPYVLATASPGGTYYPVGVAIATLVKAQLGSSHGIEMVAAPTAGSVENLALLARGEAQFAIVQSLVGHDAWVGGTLFADGRAQRGFRAVCALWRNVEQFVLRTEHVRTGTVSDLLAVKGARIVLGDHRSGTLVSSRVLLANLGIDVDQDFELAYMGYGPAGDALQAGEIVAMSAAAGLPTKSVARAKAAMGGAITILGFTPEQAARADGGLGLWAPYTIPAGTYADQPEPISTIAQPNLLLVDAGLAEEVVYRITRVLFEQHELLRSMHEATRDIRASNALAGLTVALHPGAQRYFEEVGLAIPQPSAR